MEWAKTNILCLVSDETLAQGIQCSFDSFGMTLEGALTPAILTFFVDDLDEEPAGEDAEVFDGLDFGHVGDEGKESTESKSKSKRARD